jgi:hypothetical protein
LLPNFLSEVEGQAKTHNMLPQTKKAELLPQAIK